MIKPSTPTSCSTNPPHVFHLFCFVFRECAVGLRKTPLRLSRFANFHSFSSAASFSGRAQRHTPAETQEHVTADMSTRVAVVTGSNKGIGLAVVRALCKQFEGDVFLTARDVGRGEAAVQVLNAEGLKPMFHQLDIDDLNSIKTAADFFKEKYGGVDILVNNAAIAFKMADKTPFGIQAEVTLKTNFFSTRNMLTCFSELIKPGGRVVNVSSMVSVRALNQCNPDLQQHFRRENITEDELAELMQRFIDDAKKGEHKQCGWPDTAYGVSKIGLTVLSMIHARRLSKERPDDGILLNACCPGWVRTDMAGPKAPKSPDEGAVTPVYLALLPPGAKEPHGQFVSEKTVQKW